MDEWRTERFRQKLGNKKLFATTEALFFRITSQASAEVPDLQCKREEADGCLLLHAPHAGDEGYSSVMIRPEDTDVFIMSVSFADEIFASLFFKCGTRNRTKLVDINRVAASLGRDVCKEVVGMHADTGRDSVSAFAGKQKSQVLKLVKTDKGSRETFTELGQEWDLSAPETVLLLDAFVWLMG